MASILLILLNLFSFNSSDASARYNEALDAIVIEQSNPLFSGLSENEVTVCFGEVDKPSGQPSVIGTLAYQDAKLLYRAKYGFSEGSTYTVFIRDTQQPEPVLLQRILVRIPKPYVEPSTYLKNVFPSAGTLPMNQLKFYLDFSAPMREGNAYEHIKLFRMPEGQWEEEAFLSMPEELWDPERKRLTIFFDPGRIKRGVQPNLQLGLPLVEGRNYKLVVDKDWLDINNVTLVHSYEKIFEVGTVDRSRPNPDDWMVEEPIKESMSPISIDFGEPMDYGLLHSAIVIVNQKGEQVKGTIQVAEAERLWLFVPNQPWEDTEYRLVINAWLEDLAGNNLKRKFDVDLNDPADVPKNITEVIIPFKTTHKKSDQ